ncbi:uncharacterized protein LOC144434020 [Glandiceps talaboti]
MTTKEEGSSESPASTTVSSVSTTTSISGISTTITTVAEKTTIGSSSSSTETTVTEMTTTGPVTTTRITTTTKTTSTPEATASETTEVSSSASEETTILKSTTLAGTEQVTVVTTTIKPTPAIQRGCKYNGEDYDIGDKIQTEDVCINLNCTEMGFIPDEVTCNYECGENEYPMTYDGECCPRCVKTSSDNCRVMAAEEQIIKVDDCVSPNKVALTYCSGRCASNVTVIASLPVPYMATECTCCKPLRTKTEEITLTCADGLQEKRFEYAVIEACDCQACADKSPSDNPADEENVI